MKLAGNRLRLGAAALLTAIGLGALITPGIASAGTPSLSPSVEHPETGNGGTCYEQVTQYKYRKYKTEYKYIKWVKGTIDHQKHGVPDSNFDWLVWPTGSEDWDYDNKPVLRSGPHSDKWDVQHGDHEDEYKSTHYEYRNANQTQKAFYGSTTDWLASPPNDGNSWEQVDARTGPYGQQVPCDNDETKQVTLCHATGSESNPYTKITVSVSAFYSAGHISHGGDIYEAFSYVKHGQTHNIPAHGDASLLQYADCERPKPEKPSFPPEVVERFGECAVGANTVSGSRTTTSFKAVFNPQTWTWDKVQHGDAVVETITRLLSADDQAKCQPTYDPKVEVTQGDCAAGANTVSVTTTTTNYKAVYSGGVWTQVEVGEPVVEVTSRPLNEQERAKCQPTKQPTIERDDVGDPECGETTIQVKVTTTTYSYTYNEQTKSWVEAADEPIVTYEARQLTEEEQYQCSTYDLSVVCTSAGPDYGSWLVDNNANQPATVKGVSIAAGGSHVFNVVADAVTFPVVWQDGLQAELSSQGENDCTYEPPATTQPPTTTEPPVTQPPTVTTDPAGLDISAIGPVCVQDAPFVEVTFGAQSQFNGRPATVTFRDLAGNVVETATATYQAGATVRFVHPGASVDAAGNATDWPGWMFDGDEWVVDPSDAYLRDGLTVVVDVNPTATATVSFPPATAACANPAQVDPAPPTTATVPAGELPQTGSSTAVLASIAAILLLAGGGALMATRRSTAQD